jgi:putative transcriptional regulator
MATGRNIADEILEGLNNAIAFVDGDVSKGRIHSVEVPDVVDVKALRRRLGYTQAEFANRYGFALSAVQEWEKRRRRPDRSARILLKLIDREPEAVERALAR